MSERAPLENGLTESVPPFEEPPAQIILSTLAANESTDAWGARINAELDEKGLRLLRSEAGFNSYGALRSLVLHVEPFDEWTSR